MKDAMSDADRKYVQDVKNDYFGRHMTEQAPEQRLLEIIERMEAQFEEAKSDAKKECRRALLLSKQCDSLEDQLQSLKKVAEPFEKLDKAVHSDEWGIERPTGWYGISLVNLKDTDQTISVADPEIHALAEKLDEVDDG